MANNFIIKEIKKDADPQSQYGQALDIARQLNEQLEAEPESGKQAPMARAIAQLRNEAVVKQQFKAEFMETPETEIKLEDKPENIETPEKSIKPIKKAKKARKKSLKKIKPPSHKKLSTSEINTFLTPFIVKKKNRVSWKDTALKLAEYFLSEQKNMKK